MKKVAIQQLTDEQLEKSKIEKGGYTKIQLDEINLGTEPIKITPSSIETPETLMHNKIKLYVKIILLFIAFLILALIILTLKGKILPLTKDDNLKNNIHDTNITLEINKDNGKL